jgi:hypothetical protein
VALRREVDHVLRAGQSLRGPDVHAPELDVADLGRSDVVAIHLRIGAAELKGDVFAHHADGVHGVDERLDAGIE